MSDLRELYQEVIIDHNRNPRNFHKMQDANKYAEGYNPLCGDQLNLFLKIAEDVIQEVSFEGSGCAISTASASLMTEALKGKTIQQAEALFNTVHGLLTKDEATDWDRLGKLVVLAGVKEFPARVKCATLAWHTLHSALTNQVIAASTE
ncbi:MAG: iron-sulfur cluster assembly scaffold protein SufE2 [Gammaproteobacteria bacterium]|jgi:nitrogen fixation NifU-like protein|nr:iron-sulfur cluster assembly scaffold protein SufE2 [Gammaproteobacteria bacterium]